MALKPHAVQIHDVALANGWAVSPRTALEQWYNVAFVRGVERITVRYDKNGRIVVGHITDGSGVVFEPRRNKFREVLVTLSAKSA